MDNVNTMIKMAMDKYHDEYGENAKLDDGEEFVTVFNDAVLIIGMDCNELKVKIVAGEPYVIDFNCDLLQ